MKDLKQTRKLLQETERKREELESANHSHKQKLQSVEVGYEEQLNQMRDKVTELTNKLAASDRRLKRFNRKSSGRTTLPKIVGSIGTLQVGQHCQK